MSAEYNADDYYKVDRIDGGFLVKHYPDRDTRKACCNLRVKITPADVEQAHRGADPHGECQALHRCYLAIEKKHGRIVDNNSR